MMSTNRCSLDNLPLVSVIIPCYNCEKYVRQAVRSICNQTYKNLEIIITDDNSMDSTVEIIYEIQKEDDRILLFQNSKNLNIVATLNNMIDVAHGKYIARMDGDDYSSPVRIEREVTFLESNTDYAICGCEAYIINENDKIVGRSFNPNSDEDIRKYINLENPFYHPSILVRADVLKVFKYQKSFEYAEDYYLWTQILSIGKGYNLPSKLLLYRTHAMSVSKLNEKSQCVLSEKIKVKTLNGNACKISKLRSRVYCLRDQYKYLYYTYRFFDIVSTYFISYFIRIK